MSTGTGTGVLITNASWGSVADIVDRIRLRVRDVIGNTFSDDVLLMAVAAGVRHTFPSLFHRVTIELGTVSGSAETVALASPPVVGYAANEPEFWAVEYRTGARWLAITGSSYDGTAIELGRVPGRDLRMRAVFLVPRFPYGSMTVEMDTTTDLLRHFSVAELDAVEDLGLSWLLDGYLAGRIPYDKFTTVTSDDAISPFEIQAAAREFSQRAHDRLEALAQAKPSIRVM